MNQYYSLLVRNNCLRYQRRGLDFDTIYYFANKVTRKPFFNLIESILKHEFHHPSRMFSDLDNTEIYEHKENGYQIRYSRNDDNLILIKNTEFDKSEKSILSQILESQFNLEKMKELEKKLKEQQEKTQRERDKLTELFGE